LKQLLPVYEHTLPLLADAIPDLVVCVPTLPRFEDQVRGASAGWPLRSIVAAGLARSGLFEACNAALAASGTVTLELAAAGLPMVVTYKVNPLTAAIARRVLKVPHVALPNLILGKAAVPELLQENATPRRLANAVLDLFGDPQSQRPALERCMIELGRGGDDPSLRAARVVMALGAGSV
jgi:lipid-A-disaccharide synthase